MEAVDDPFGLPPEELDEGYQEPDLSTTADEIQQRVFDDLATRAPGWEAHDGNLDVWLVEAFSSEAADIRELAVDVPSAIFRAFGEQIMGIPARQPVPATATATWTAVDDSGYTIEPGFQIAIPRTGDENVAFEVTMEVTIPPGETTTQTGEVPLAAVIEGEQGNGLTGPVEVLEPIDWVLGVVLELPTAGGDDGQTDEQYLDEMSLLMRLVALRPVVPGDFAIMALQVPGVGRAIAMDGYDAGAETWGNDRMITLVLTDEAGQPVPTSVRQAVDDLLESRREVNFIVEEIDAEYQTIDVSYECTTYVGFDPEIVRSDVNTAVAAYLSPANWRLGLSSPDTSGGEVILGPPAEGGRSVIRKYEIASLISVLGGVDFVTEIRINGADADLTLSGLTTLPQPGTIDGTVTTPGGVVSSP